MKIYIIGSLRNPDIPHVGNALRAEGYDAFDDWYGAGERADDAWKEYEVLRGRSFGEAIKGYAAKHVFAFDQHHLDTSDAAVLVLPAGKSGHLELGYLRGQGKPTYILFPDNDNLEKISEMWYWLAGIYEGEGSLCHSSNKNRRSMQLSVTMRDKDIIDQLLAVSGVGRIQGPYSRKEENHNDTWRWSVYKRQDVMFVINGMYPLLGERRRGQIDKVLNGAGITVDELALAAKPQELRWDVMYQFATVVFSKEELINELKRAA